MDKVRGQGKLLNMNTEQRKQYKAKKAKEYRDKQKTVDNPRGQPENVDNSVDSVVQPRGQLRSQPTGAFELESLTTPPPSGVDKEKWRVAQDRAEVARRYAQPERYQFIRPDEEAFQTVRWQYDELERYPVANAPQAA